MFDQARFDVMSPIGRDAGRSGIAGPAGWLAGRGLARGGYGGYPQQQVMKGPWVSRRHARNYEALAVSEHQRNLELLSAQGMHTENFLRVSGEERRKNIETRGRVRAGTHGEMLGNITGAVSNLPKDFTNLDITPEGGFRMSRPGPSPTGSSSGSRQPSRRPASSPSPAPKPSKPSMSRKEIEATLSAQKPHAGVRVADMTPKQKAERDAHNKSLRTARAQRDLHAAGGAAWAQRG